MRISRFLTMALLLSGSLLSACNNKPADTTTDAPTEATADSARIEQPTDEVSRPATEGGAGDQTNTGQTTSYICPMKCEGSASNQPGKCPKCGMDLEKQS